MRARIAYISSLGTTGVLVASALVMLILVGALLAFDRWPTHAVAEAETVPIADDGPRAIRRAAPAATKVAADPAPSARAARLTRASQKLVSAAARAGRVESHAAGTAPAQTVRDPVVSSLPAPESAPQPTVAQQEPAAQPAPSSDSPAPAPAPVGSVAPGLPIPPGTLDPSNGDVVGDTTSEVSGAVGQLSPSLGQTVRDTGTTVDQTIGGLLDGSGG